MTFIKLNQNPLNKKTGDCVVRAISYATKQSWFQVYRDLVKLGLDECEMPNSKKIYEKYLEQIGWKKMPMPKARTGITYKRLKVKEMSSTFEDELIIIRVVNHLTVLEYGNLVDTWNCENKSSGNYWTK